MMHKAWCSIEEVPYYFLGSSIKFWGHTSWKMDDSNPIWVRLLGRSQLSNPSDLPCYPSALWAGGVLSSRSGRVGSRSGGRLPDLRNPYLCDRSTDYLHSKFCGIVQACSCALSFAHLPHMGLPMGQKLVKFATNWVQTLRIAYLWNRWMDVPHLKIHGLV